jgi:hypothetical protein
LFRNHGPRADAKQRGHNGVVGPGVRDPNRHARPCRWSPSRTRRREKKRQGNSLVSLSLALPITKFPSSPLAPVATSGSKPRYEFLPRATDFLRFIRSPTPIASSPSAEPWILGPRFGGSWPWVSHRRGGSGRSAADSWPLAWGCGCKDSSCALAWLDCRF